jgi:hypothetical protein
VVLAVAACAGPGVDEGRPGDDATGADAALSATLDAAPGGGDAPAGADPQESGGAGGISTGGAYDLRTAANGVPYRLHTPVDYTPAVARPLLVGLSGTEGRETYTQVFSLVYPTRAAPYVVVVIGGPDVGQSADSGTKVQTVMNEVKALFNIDLRRQYLNTVSYGTVAGLYLGFGVAQDELCALWFTAPIASAEPALSATELGFSPAVGTAYGEASPGNAAAAADIRSRAQAKGYAPVIDFPRPGGHSPSVPGAEWERMWQLFGDTVRP